MSRFRNRTTASGRFAAWLLWLGLVVPLAQAAASWHAFSHLRGTPASETQTKYALHVSHCNLCLMAAAVAGGAATGATPARVRAPVAETAPDADVVDVWQAPAVRVYLSRAPPLLSV